ncbi:MAG: amino acid adenylation domain-containing protein [Erysipelotrichaceae bacterium]|nr:amino acid adenylation domain-containing protein [Erysipelotrichaceae bacterium]
MITNVIDYLDHIVVDYHDKKAYCDDYTTYTFGDVYELSRRIGSYFIHENYYHEPIIVFMKKSPQTITSFFGIVYSGCYYIPIDEQMPKQRLNMIFDSLNARALICDENSYDMAKDLDGFSGKIYLYEELIQNDIDNQAIAEVKSKHLDTDLLYILFTSGSTGKPKGVVLSHRQIIDYTESLGDILHFSDQTIFGNQTPLYFDASLKELYGTIKWGATTYLIDKQLFMFPYKLVEYLNEHKINTITWASSALVIVSSFGTFEKIVPQYIHTITFSTEVFPTKQFNIWRKALPDANFYNLYGPTEATGVCTYYHVVDDFADNENIPIGVAFPNSEIILLDENNKVPQDGNVGELCVKGACLAFGYFKNKEKTDEVFVQNPLNDMYPEIIYRTGDLAKYNENHQLVFVSRKDYQIKHMGHRIELGEIEQNVNSIEEIQSCCCVYNDVKEKIVLFYVGNITKDEIKKYLKDRIPRYMIPNKTIQLETMPLNINDKIDRTKLKAMALENNKK